MAVVAVVLGLDEMLFALAPQGGRPTEATCAFAGALVNVLGVNVLGFGVWTLIYTAPRWDSLVHGTARGAPIPIAPKMARPVWRSQPVRAQYGARFPIGGRRALCAAQAGAGSRAKSELQHERHRDGAPWPPQSPPHTSEHPMVEGHTSGIDPHRPPLSRNTLKNQPRNADSDVSST